MFPPGFAVIDVETTGLRATVDRIVEIAIVRTDIHGAVIAELVTLINPERSPGASHIHGLSAEDLQGAPLFPEIVPEIFRFLKGAVLVGHNVKFDAGFLDAELVRANQPFPRAPLVCTRDLAMRLEPALNDYRLSSVCRALGIRMGQEHRALADAQAARELLGRFLGNPIVGKQLLLDVESVQSIEWPALAGNPRLVMRGAGEQTRQAEEARLESALAGLPEGLSGKSISAYQALLDELLEDRRINDEKAERVRDLAQKEGLSKGDVRKAHQAYLALTARASLLKDLEGGAGALDLARVARLLGLSEDDCAGALAEARKGEALIAEAAQRPLRAGMSVCFSGDTVPPKELLEWRAGQAGLRVASGVSKKLDVLVVDDPYSITSKAQKARTLGTRMMVVPVFLSLLPQPS